MSLHQTPKKKEQKQDSQNIHTGPKNKARNLNQEQERAGGGCLVWTSKERRD
jgi:hypothetical protein